MTAGARPAIPAGPSAFRSGRLLRPLALRGAIAVVFGAILLAADWTAVSTLAVAFGVFLIAAAAAAILVAERFSSRSLAVLAAVEAVIGLLLCLHRPWEGLHTLAYLAGAWATAAGILEMFAAGAFHRDRRTERLEAGAGAVLAILGVFLAVYPETSLAPIANWTGAALLASGTLLLIAAARLKSKG